METDGTCHSAHVKAAFRTNGLHQFLEAPTCSDMYSRSFSQFAQLEAVGRRDGSPLQKDQGRTVARDPKQSATQCDEGLPKHFHAAARRKRVGTSAAVPRWPLRHLEKTKPQLAAANFWRGGCEIKRGRAMQVPGRYPDIGRPSLTSTPVANMGRTILGAALMLRPGWRAGGPQFWREQPEGSEVCCVF